MDLKNIRTLFNFDAANTVHFLHLPADFTEAGLISPPTFSDNILCFQHVGWYDQRWLREGATHPHYTSMAFGHLAHWAVLKIPDWKVNCWKDTKNLHTGHVKSGLMFAIKCPVYNDLE